MTSLFKLVSAAVVSCLTVQTLASGFLGRPTDLIVPYKREALQDIVSAMISERCNWAEGFVLTEVIGFLG
jgi:hypothetical protein